VADDLVRKLHASLTANPPRTFRTGFRWLDRMTGGGLRSGDVSVVTAFSGYGKSAFLEQVALEASTPKQARVLFLPLEMGEAKTMRRLAAKIARCSEADFISTFRGQIDPLTAGALSERNLAVREPRPRRRVNVAKIAELIKADRPDIVMVDHVRELDGWLSDARNGHVGPTQICQQFEDLAHSENVHIMLAAQLSSDSKGKRPDLWKPQDTVALEQIASLWIKLHRPFSGRKDDNVEMVIIAKNRYGPPNIAHPYRWEGTTASAFEFDEQALAEVERRLSPKAKVTPE
jgi:replicative DNA helicase